MRRGLWVFFFISTLFFFNAAHADDAEVLLHKTDNFDIAPTSARSAIISVNGSALPRHLGAPWTLHLEIDRARSPLDRFRINIRDQLSRLFPNLFPTIQIANNQQVVGWVWWNGKPILEPRDFARQPRGTFILTRPIPLKETNELQFHLKGPRGSVGKILLTGLVPLPPAPVLAPVTSPTFLVIQNLNGTAEPGATVQIDFNGQSSPLTASAQNGSFSKILNLSLGENTVNVTQVDRFGLISEEITVLIIRDNPDQDGDGYSSQTDDCNDANEDIHPGAMERCDGVDNNCTHGIDEAGAIDARLWYLDEDEDGFGDANSFIPSCSPLEGFVGDPSDCDDALAEVNTAAEEICDGIDNNCNDDTDENIPRCVGGFLDHLPPDPSSVAPDLNATQIPSFLDANSFLYTGTDPIQKSVAPNAIDPLRAAILRGKVMDRSHQPLAGAVVSILGHPEYGTTRSREDGLFDMVVNGGGSLNIAYTLDDTLPAHRKVDPLIRDTVWAEDVVMIPLDPVVTTVSLTDPGMKVAQGSPVSDTNGSRQSTLLFPENVTARLDLPNGTTGPLSTLHVRATEYTIGDNGPETMPAALPPTSGYTYAFELSVDEALAQQATSVRFDKPLIYYVDNFLGFPVGGIVPAGYYDKEKAAWVPSNNGRILKILRIDNGLTVLDVTGNGAESDPATLASLGIDVAERTKLATLYPAGKTLWRVPIPHFTAWDCNWAAKAEAPFVTPTGLSDLAEATDTADEPCSENTGKNESSLECENQTASEDFPLSGTSFSLNYHSDRVPGRLSSRRLNIPLSGSFLPATVKRIELEIIIAGQKISRSYSPQPNQTDSFTWDGKDAYGRSIQGAKTAQLRLGYVYNAVPVTPSQFGQAFAQYGENTTVTGNRPRGEITLWQEARRDIGSLDQKPLGFGGTSLSVHHFYDPQNQILYYGNGKRRHAASLDNVASTLAGTGAIGSGGDGLLALQGQLNQPRDVAVDSKGNIYIADTMNNRIRKINPQGIFSTVAGNGTRGSSGLNGLAIQAQLNRPWGIGIDAKDNLYIADSFNHRVLKVEEDGTLIRVAGDGTLPSTDDRLYGDGGPATLAKVRLPTDVDVDPEGNIYIADMGNQRIRKVSPDGIITTIAGKATTTSGIGDGRSAVEAILCGDDNQPDQYRLGIDVDHRSNVYVSEAGCRHIRKITPDGIIRTVAGRVSGTGQLRDGEAATLAYLESPKGVIADREGNFYIAEANRQRLRKVNAKGIITTVMGTSTASSAGDGGPATAANLFGPNGVTLDAEGNLLVIESTGNKLRKIGSPFPGISANGYTIAAEDGAEVYQFNAQGKHQRTLHALTGAVLYTFHYTADGTLDHVIDANNRTTAITRDPQGKPTGIESPEGLITTVQLNGDGYLEFIENPEGERTNFTYYPGGLLHTVTDPKQNTVAYFYDTVGRVRQVETPNGGRKVLSRTENGNQFTVTSTTALDATRTTTQTYQVTQEPIGDRKRTIKNPRNLITTITEYKNQKDQIDTPDGMKVETTQGPDPRFGFQAPLIKEHKITTPAGLTQTTTLTRQVTLANPADYSSLTLQRDTVVINGKTFLQEYNGSTRKFTMTSPLLRKNYVTLDAKGRVGETQTDGLHPVTYTYNTDGKLWKITQSNREYVLTYDAGGFLHTITDPLNQLVTFTNDDAGRVHTQILPGQTSTSHRTISYTYDLNGNLKTLTPPGKPAHEFVPNAMDQEDEYNPPNISGLTEDKTFTDYTLDNQLDLISYPDSQTIDFVYEATGDLDEIHLTDPQDIVDIGYDSVGRIQAVTAPDGNTLTYTYDGSLLKLATWAGTINGSVERSYDNFLRISSYSVNAANPISYGYDDDGLLASTGILSIARYPTHGFIDTTVLSNVTTKNTYTDFGELDLFTTKISGSDIYVSDYDYDALGRIDIKKETVQGTLATYDYDYYPSGMLKDVKINGVLSNHYEYDKNGNRLIKTGMATPAVYDDQDRLASYNGNTYAYTANGELDTKTNAQGLTDYEYDEFGNLTFVELPDGTTIDYIMDGSNRRIGKMVNGTLVQGFLYQDQLEPIAELDGNGTIVSRFIYGTKSHVPDYMIKGGVIYRIVSDYLGSVRLVINVNNGNIAQRMDYDEFGIVINDTALGFQPFGFAGGIYDQQTKLVRFGVRDYDADIGRWTSKDPIGFDGNDSNLFGYTFGDPVNWIDSSGEIAIALPVILPVLGEAAGYTAAVLVGIITGNALSDYLDKILEDSTIAAPTIADGPTCPIQASKSNPISGKPGTSSTIKDKYGNPKQRREYGEDGYPKRDTDYDHDHGRGKPHVHDWGRPSGGGRPTKSDRGPGRPL